MFSKKCQVSETVDEGKFKMKQIIEQKRLIPKVNVESDVFVC